MDRHHHPTTEEHKGNTLFFSFFASQTLEDQSKLGEIIRHTLNYTGCC
jgi:hypothetical protein